MADGHSKKLVVALGFFFFAVMTFLSGIVPTFTLFLLVRSLVGLGQGSFYGPAYGLINENLSDRHATLGMAIINSGQGVGQILGTLLASTLVIQNQDHWSTPFLVLALPTVMVGFLYLYGLPKEGRPIRYGGKSVNARGGQQQSLISSLAAKLAPKIWRPFFKRPLVGAYWLLFCSIYGQIAMLTWLPTFLLGMKNIDQRFVGLIASIVPLIAIPSALILAKKLDQTAHARRFLYLFVPLSALALVLGSLSQNSTQIVLALILYGLTGKMTIDPLLLQVIRRHAPKGRVATTFGLYNFMGMLASITASYLTGWLTDVTGTFSVGFDLAAALLLLGLLGFGLSQRNAG
ncbi:MFS transporter [Fructobacillus cardui]